MPNGHSRVVTIIQRRLTGYRVPFFENLKLRLEKENVRLRLLHGVGTSTEATKDDAGQITWAEPLTTKYFLTGKICWQPFAQEVSGSDLLILTQENVMLANHLALLRRPVPRLAFWGHGGNFQGDPRSIREHFKRWSTRQVDWYFAYTCLSVDLVARAGFPLERITQLDNAIDLSEITAQIMAVSDLDMAKMSAELSLSNGPVGLFLGSLYTHKRLEFLVEAAEHIRDQIPDFQLVIVGAGPDLPVVERAIAKHNWIRYAGPRRGFDKAVLLRMGTILMNPGLVGLGILDSFVSELPLVTTDCGLHSPEIAYLNADNGVMAKNNLDSYVYACNSLLTNADKRMALSHGCRQAAQRYTLPNMVENYVAGILNALDAPL